MAYKFATASSQYLELAAAPVTAVPLSISLWFNTANVSNVDSLFTIQDGNGNDQFLLYYGGNDFVVMTIQGSTLVSATRAITGLTNQWVHVCGVYSAINNRQAWVNGVSGGANINTGTATPNAANIDTVRVNVRYYAGSLGSYGNANIAEIAVYNTALGEDEIVMLSKGFSASLVKPQNLVYYAPLIRDLGDIRGGLIHTNNNGATVSAHPKIYGI